MLHIETDIYTFKKKVLSFFFSMFLNHNAYFTGKNPFLDTDPNVTDYSIRCELQSILDYVSSHILVCIVFV